MDAIIYLDIQKTFDTLPHNKLLTVSCASGAYITEPVADSGGVEEAEAPPFPSYQNLCQLYHTLQKAIMRKIIFNKHTVTYGNGTFRKHTFSHNF